MSLLLAKPFIILCFTSLNAVIVLTKETLRPEINRLIPDLTISNFTVSTTSGDFLMCFTKMEMAFSSYKSQIAGCFKHPDKLLTIFASIDYILELLVLSLSTCNHLEFFSNHTNRVSSGLNETFALLLIESLNGPICA